MAIEVVAKNHLQPPKTMILPQIIWLKSSRSFILFNISFACHLYALIFYLYVLVCHSCVSRVYSYLIHMSLVCTCMSSVCHSYVLVCHPYVVLPWIQYPPPHYLAYWYNETSTEMHTRQAIFSILYHINCPSKCLLE